MTRLDTYPPLAAVDAEIEELQHRIAEAISERLAAEEAIGQATQTIEGTQARLSDLSSARELLERSRPEPSRNGKKGKKGQREKKAGRPRKTSPRAQRGVEVFAGPTSPTTRRRRGSSRGSSMRSPRAARPTARSPRTPGSTPTSRVRSSARSSAAVRSSCTRAGATSAPGTPGR